MIAYHATSKDYVDSIAERGIRPRHSNNFSGKFEPLHNAVYVSCSEDDARDAVADVIPDPVVIEVEIDPAILLPDEDEIVHAIRRAATSIISHRDPCEDLDKIVTMVAFETEMDLRGRGFKPSGEFLSVLEDYLRHTLQIECYNETPAKDIPYAIIDDLASVEGRDTLIRLVSLVKVFIPCHKHDNRYAYPQHIPPSDILAILE